VEWDNGSETQEPLEIIIKDDPISEANYAEENNLLDTPGWKWVKHFAKNKPRLARMVKQAKRTNKHKSPIYQFGIQVPRNVGNTLWQDAMSTEIGSIQAYKTFKDMGIVPYYHLSGVGTPSYHI